VMGHRRPPGMQDCGEADLGTQVLRVSGLCREDLDFSTRLRAVGPIPFGIVFSQRFKE